MSTLIARELYYLLRPWWAPYPHIIPSYFFIRLIPNLCFNNLFIFPFLTHLTYSIFSILFFSISVVFKGSLPTGVQLDWEAIFECDVDLFVKRSIALLSLWSWEQHTSASGIAVKPLLSLADIELHMKDDVSTARDMLVAVLATSIP